MAMTDFTEQNGATRIIPGSNHFDDKVDFGKTLNDGSGGAAKTVPLKIDGPAGTVLSPTGSMFGYAHGTATFDPTANGNQTGTLQIIAPDGQVDGHINLAGTGVASFVGPALSVYSAPIVSGATPPALNRVAYVDRRS